jgi:hypothetical protein
MSEDIKSNWTAKQTYLVLGNLLNAAAELNIDSTPMEGFNPVQFNEILGLDKLNLNTALVVPVGYRHEEDDTQHLKKRKSNEDLFINYNYYTKQIKQMKKFKINYFSISSTIYFISNSAN